MAATARDPKWKKQGWRIEPHYDSCVMVGNWAEERLKFRKGTIPSNNTIYGSDYRAFNRIGGPNVTNRRRALIREDGLPYDQLIKHHHGYSQNMITWYDEHFNRRERPLCQAFPYVREYSTSKLAWLPEKSDYPLEGPPTNYGLLPKLEQKWRTQSSPDLFESTYRGAYRSCAAPAQPRYATPRAHSSTMNPVNRVLNDIALRGSSRPLTTELLGPPSYPAFATRFIDTGITA